MTGNRDEKGRFIKGYNPWNKQPIVYKTCESCGKRFKVKPCNKERCRFCSHKCYWENLKRRPTWNKGLTKDSDLRVRKYANSLKGHPHRGVESHTPSTIKKMSEKRRAWHEKNEFHHSDDTKRVISKKLKGREAPSGWHHSEEAKNKIATAMKNREIKWGNKISIGQIRRWDNYTPEQKSKIVKAVFNATNRRPNGLERSMFNLLETNNLGFKYVGDGGLIVGGKCPDFARENLLIEVYGQYWHREDDPQDRINEFSKYGYRTLVIWEGDMSDQKRVLNMINNFIVGS